MITAHLFCASILSAAGGKKSVYRSFLLTAGFLIEHQGHIWSCRSPSDHTELKSLAFLAPNFDHLLIPRLIPPDFEPYTAARKLVENVKRNENVNCISLWRLNRSESPLNNAEDLIQWQWQLFSRFFFFFFIEIEKFVKRDEFQNFQVFFFFFWWKMWIEKTFEANSEAEVSLKQNRTFY